MSKKIGVFTGTRAEYGLLYWLLNEIKNDSELGLSLIVSGSHLSPEFGLTYKNIENDGFKIDEKVEILLSSDTPVGVAKSMGLALIGFSDAFERQELDLLIILGDRFEALAAAQTALLLKVPVLHLHGGEITEGAYDDSIRHAISKISYLHGVSTNEYRNRVIQMGEHPDRVVNVGALGIEHLHRTQLLSKEQLGESLQMDLSSGYFLVTYHPVTLASEDPENTFNALLDSLDEFPDKKVIITYPNADDGGRKIIPLIDDYASKHPGRVFACKSLGQIRYLSAVKYAMAVIGNSSSGIIEVPSFKVPTINIGVRQKGRLAAKSVIHVSPKFASIRDAMRLLIRNSGDSFKENIANPYGDGCASKKIIELIKNSELSVVKKFFDMEKNL